jgi:spore coat-associated protein N
MAKHTQNESGTKRGRTVLAAAFAVAGLAITGMGVYAGLNATASGSQAVTSGTLKLTTAPGTGSAGFALPIANMAPGDVENRFITLTNGGTLPAQNATVAVTGSTLLATSAAKGLHLAITGCSVPWVVNTTLNTGTCADVLPPTVLADTTVSTLSTPAALSISNPIAPGAINYLRLALTLPNQNETTVDGTLPAGTIQGLVDTLSFTFNEVQRAATTVNG